MATKTDQMSQVPQQDPEIKGEIKVNVLNVSESNDIMSKLTGYYSGWFQLKIATAWMLRFKEILLQLCKARKQLKSSIAQSEKDPEKQTAFLQDQMQKYRSTVRGKSLSLEDLIQAEIQLLQYSQKQHFSEEIEALRNNVPVKKRSPLYKLDPMLQDGILRVGGRLNKAAMPEESTHHVVLSKHSRISTLILSDIHQRYGHCGRNYLLSMLRQKFWIPQGNSAIRKLICQWKSWRAKNGKPARRPLAT